MGPPADENGNAVTPPVPPQAIMDSSATPDDATRAEVGAAVAVHQKSNVHKIVKWCRLGRGYPTWREMRIAQEQTGCKTAYCEWLLQSTPAGTVSAGTAQKFWSFGDQLFALTVPEGEACPAHLDKNRAEFDEDAY